MGPFYIVVGDVLRHGPSEVLLANRHQPVETFLFDRTAQTATRRRRLRAARSQVTGESSHELNMLKDEERTSDDFHRAGR